MTRVGILALQGDVAEHGAMLCQAGAEPVMVKRREQLDQVDGLVIPGGESTTIGKLLRRFDLLDPIQQRARAGFPVYGTCAGMILLADQIEDAGQDQPSIGGMDITVQRNAFGRQVDSFEADLDLPAVGSEPFHGVFIRAPLIKRVGQEVDVLAELDDGRAVAARQGNLLVSSFHPELTDDARLHRYFVEMVEGQS
ncbi:MAG: pyridoxal 5'-phosphate synthase glutaminase subunit PdxT [Chloroflexota bacterium]|nr:pyridoxal 5'-phosphate synthase glutaminase subunit PdxT [Chloroflexota bacterium]